MILDVSLNLIIEPFLSKNIKFSLSKTSSGLKFSKYLILEKLYFDFILKLSFINCGPILLVINELFSYLFLMVH